MLANLALGRRWARVTLFVLLGVVLAAWALTGVAIVAGTVVASALQQPLDSAQRASALKGGAGQLLTAGAAALTLLRPVRARLARWLPVDGDNPVHMLALVLTGLLFGSQLTAQLATDVLAEEARSGLRLSELDLVAQELPFLVAAAAGVGLFVRRRPGEVLSRLGWVRPRWWQLVLALALAGILYGVSNEVDRLSHLLTPDLARKLDAANERLLGGLQASLLGILTLALAAGISEETIFRGALQPRLGLAWPALLFASVHTQYGLTLASLFVLLAGLVLGLLRRYANTTTSAVCHVSYNALAGFGLGGAGLLGAAAAEAVMLATLAGYVAFRTRRGLNKVPPQ